MRLTTFRISHFSEKARWALDYNAVAYEERQLLPGAHLPTVRRVAPRSTVPVLEHDGDVVQGSSAILDYLERRLGATALAPPPALAERSAQLETMLDRALGRGTQQIFYDALLETPKEVVAIWSQDGPFWARPFYSLTMPLLGRSVRKLYRITPETIVEAKDAFRRALDETDRLLESSPHLLGDKLSRVDITVAALLGPACRPPEHLVRWPTEIPPRLEDFLRENEQRPTYAYVLRLYREHRHARARD